jgi:hypothetical protein
MKPQFKPLIGACAGITTLVFAALQPARSAEELPFSKANLFFELNNTDGDLGLHALIDGEDWKNLTITSPHDTLLLQVLTRGSLRRQGMTEISFESAEPQFADLPVAEFLRRFPEGTYELEAITVDGDELESDVTISHVIPAPAVPSHPRLAACDSPASASAPVTIRWNAVTRSHPTIGTPNQPVAVERYEVALERLDGSGLKLLAELPPTMTSFAVPAVFTSAPGTIKFEILVKSAAGNRTGTESCFAIR